MFDCSMDKISTQIAEYCYNNPKKTSEIGDAISEVTAICSELEPKRSQKVYEHSS